MELDLLFSLTFDKSYQEFLHNAMITLTENNGKALYFKRNAINETLNETFKTIDAKRIAPGNYIPDSYTHDLIRNYFNHRGDYETNPVTYFIEEHLEQIKERHKDRELSIPGNIQLTKQETVELLARYEALGIFLRRLDSIEKVDTLDIVRAKLSKDGYKAGTSAADQQAEASLGEDQDNTTSGFGKEFTVSRQILAIKYLLRFAGFDEKQTDKTKIAAFIRFLTGRQPKAKHIRNTGIYDRLRENPPETIADLEFIRKYFFDLKLAEIVSLIDDEIAVASKNR